MDNLSAVEAIFFAALNKCSPEERAAYLEATCGADAELLRSVERLLNAQPKVGSFLQAAALGPAATVEEPGITEGPGARIGPYKLLQQIGEGGMGIVYMAEQEHPVHRKVALKIIKPGMDSAQVIARFEAERQALALMDHQNIAKVFDAGTTDTGRPYFVMELVHGVPITQFCDDHQLTPRERLELFVPVCQAIQHAHQKGIIHRDIKPSNVLVTLYDDKPVPKVIDFGVAKAIEQRLTEKTLFTQFGVLVGTFEYMSPEQAEMNALGVDTRSDIYSLGVLLYELLTGTTPLQRERLREVSLSELVRLIKEEESPRPSVRLSSSNNLPKIAAARKTEPAKLAKLVRGEIDWIVMKCLEKDRSRRYETANGLARDVERYLHDEPVEACPPSLWYRLRKFARRNKQVAIMATFLLALLVAAVGVLGVSYVQVTGALERERQTFYFHSIALAHRELTANIPDPTRAEEFLEACPLERRGWEWRYLKRLWRVEPVVLRDPGNEEIYSVAYSPDGEHLAGACGDGTIKVWHLRTRRVLATLHGHEKSVFSVAFSPTDSGRLASAGVDKTVRVWDWRAGKEIFAPLPGQEGTRHGAAYSVTFSPDGRWLAGASEGGTVRIWDAETGRLIQDLPGHEGRVGCVAFSRDGKLLASGSWLGGVRMWDARTGRCLSVLRKKQREDPIPAVAFSPDGQRLAAGHVEFFIQVWDTTTGKPLFILPQRSSEVQGLAFSQDGDRLFSASEDRTVRLWDLTTQREVLRLRGHTASCQGVALSPDGRMLASASLDGTIRLWDATPLAGNEGQEIRTFREHKGEVSCLAISPDSSWIASAGVDPTVYVWDAKTGQVIQTISDFNQAVFWMAFSPDGRCLAAIGGGQGSELAFTIRVWDSQTGQTVLLLRKPQEIRSLAFSPDGRWLALGLDDGTVKLVNARTGQEIGFEDKCHRESVWGGIAFRPDGRHLASVGREGTVAVRDVMPAYQSPGGWRAWLLMLGLCPPAAGSGHLPLAANVQLAVCSEITRPHPIFTLRSAEHPFSSVAYSSDSQRLVTASTDGQLTLWDAETGKEIRTVRGPIDGEHFAGENAAAFTPDGRGIVAVSADCAVRVWDATTLKVIETFRGHRGPIIVLAVSRDGKFFVTASEDKTVKVWDLTHLGAVPH
jgi:WD40 repeat protein/serine/threonine protein kinase